MLYFFDTSAIIKLLFEEKDELGAERVKGLFRSPCVKRTTWLCVAEAYGCLKTFWLNGQKQTPNPKQKTLNQRQYDKKLFELQKNVQKGIRVESGDWMDLKSQDFGQVRDLLRKYPKIDFADALHIVVLKHRRPLSPVFVSSDTNLICAASCENLQVWNPERSGFYPQ